MITLTNPPYAPVAGDWIPAFQAAMNALLAQGGGRLFVPAGTYPLLSGTLDFRAYACQIWLDGEGPRATFITTNVLTTPGIIITGTGNSHSFNKISNIGLRQSGGVLPVVQRANNFGICNTDAVPYQADIENVEVLYFGNSAIVIQGATGPTSVRNCSLQSCAGYGLQVVPVAGEDPQDVRIEGGNIQDCWGGINVDSAISFKASAVDIELGDGAQHPAIYTNNVTFGAVFSKMTCEIGNPAGMCDGGLVVLAGGSAGIVFEGGIFRCLSVNIPNVFLTGAGVNRNTFLGGSYEGAGLGGSAFPFVMAGATSTTIINPLLTNTFHPTKRRVDDSPANRTMAVGIATASQVQEYGTQLVSPVVNV